jgi:hypothetical protein
MTSHEIQDIQHHREGPSQPAVSQPYYVTQGKQYASVKELVEEYQGRDLVWKVSPGGGRELISVRKGSGPAKRPPPA